MAEELVIETAGVRKVYGSVHALSGLDLRVPRGAICGLLGRNGAGKTTTIKVLLGMARPTAGEARVFGLATDNAKTSVEIRSRAAFVSEDKDVYAGMTVAALVRFTSAFYPRWRAELASTYLAQFELRADARINDLSRGCDGAADLWWRCAWLETIGSPAVAGSTPGVRSRHNTDKVSRCCATTLSSRSAACAARRS